MSGCDNEADCPCPDCRPAIVAECLATGVTVRDEQGRAVGTLYVPGALPPLECCATARAEGASAERARLVAVARSHYVALFPGGDHRLDMILMAMGAAEESEGK